MKLTKLIFCVAALLPLTAGAQYSKYVQAVDEYVPAPGQFVNEMPAYEEGDTPATMARKCTDSIADGRGRLVTLGAYGGYIVFHFDHPIANVSGKKDFAVWGNAFTNAAEPAVVMVSQDENQNGLPDDTWYELKGSAYDLQGTVHGYQITYTYAPMENTPWTDNQGQSGVVRRNSYHKQEYFPLWLTAEPLTFSGTLLPDNATFTGSMFLLSAYDYGYADNQPNYDADGNWNTEGCGMDIGWAVDQYGMSVHLPAIDFVKCYTGISKVNGWIGECSSEITGAEDLHLDESVGLLSIGDRLADSPGVTHYYTPDGQRQPALRRGLNIVRKADGTVRKILIKHF